MDLSYSGEPREDGGILIPGRLKHLPSGHYEDSFMPAPLDTTGGKSDVQAVGSTNSFLRRYVAGNISTSWLSEMMTTELAAQSTGPRRKQFLR